MTKYYKWNDNVFLADSPNLTKEEEIVKDEFVRYTKAIKVKKILRGFLKFFLEI